MSGFSFGATTPQQQQQKPPTLFSTPLAWSTPITTGSGATAAASFGGTSSLFGTNVTSSSSGTGFTFSTPATTQSKGQPTGFSFGTAQPAALAPTTTTPAPATSTSTVAGLGGIPGSTGIGLSTFALGNDPGSGWSTRNDNRAVQELPVPPEIVAATQELLTQMKNYKGMMTEISRASSNLDINVVAEQIEEVRVGLTALTNLMHKQEHQSASLIKDMQEFGRNMDLLSQSMDNPSHGYGETSTLLHNFLWDLIEKYEGRMLKYKVEIERAEFSLRTIVGSYNINAKDMWASLTAIKDGVILLAAQVQQLHEDIRNELSVHKSISLLHGAKPNPWLAFAISGGAQADRNVPPLERVLKSTPSEAPTLESMYQRTYSMLNQVPSKTDPRSMLAPSSEAQVRMHGSGRQQSMPGPYIAPSTTAQKRSWN